MVFSWISYKNIWVFFLSGNPNNKERDTLLDVEKGEENRRMNDICNGNGKEESTTKGLVLGQFLSYEKLTLSNIRCTIVGCKGAGMKTFLQSLEKEIYKEQKTTNSNDTVDISINNSEVCEDKTQSKLIISVWNVLIIGCKQETIF